MKRSQLLLGALGAILLVALAWVLLYQPQREQIAEAEARIASELEIQNQLELEIADLRAVREQAPEIESEVVRSQSIVPPDIALPSLLRQLQQGADESGMVLDSVTAGRPAALAIDGDEGVGGLSELDLGLELTGRYFQLVDLLRRLEDPSITPRGIEWRNVAVSRGTYPDLTVSLEGTIYAVVEVANPPTADPLFDADAETDADAEGDDGAEPGTEGEVDEDGEPVSRDTNTEDMS